MPITRPTSHQPLPSHARKVFIGKIFDVYQWKQEMFDGGKVTFERIKRIDTVNVIAINPDGKIILSEQEQPGTRMYLSVLGGRIDEGDEPLTAAKREFLEEAGMDSSEFVFWDAVQPIGKVDWAIYTFLAKNAHVVSEPRLDAGEKIKLLPVTFDEYLKLLGKKIIETQNWR